MHARSRSSLYFLSFLTRHNLLSRLLCIPPSSASSSASCSASCSSYSSLPSHFHSPSLFTSVSSSLTTSFFHRPPPPSPFLLSSATPKRFFQSLSSRPSNNMAKRDDMSYGPILSSPTTPTTASSAAPTLGNKTALDSPKTRPANTQPTVPSTPVHPYELTAVSPSMRPHARTLSSSSPGGPRSLISQIISDSASTKGNKLPSYLTAAVILSPPPLTCVVYTL